MRLRILAPFRSDFSIESERPFQDPDGYTQFWDGVEKDCERASFWREFPEGEVALHFPHARRHLRAPFNRYRTLEKDSLERRHHILELQLDGRMVRSLLEARKWAWPRLVPRLGAATVRVFDHGLSLLEADLALEGFPSDGDEELRLALETLECQAADLGEALAGAVWEKLLAPVVHWLRSGERDQAGILEPSAAGRLTAVPPRGEVLWVARALVFEEDDAEHAGPITEHWLKHGGGEEHAAGRTVAEYASECAKAYVVRWLNYLFRERSYEKSVREGSDPESAAIGPPQKELARPLCDAWEAMLHAQYFYAALELVDANLTKILAEALNRKRLGRVAPLKRALRANLRNANLLLLQHHDSTKYYKRRVQAELAWILDYWNFEKVLVDPVEKKIASCGQRLDYLHKRDAALSAIYTDMILLVFTATAIFGTTLAVVQFGRENLTNSRWAVFDVMSTGAVQWLAAQSTDLLLAACVLLTLVLGSLIFWLKRRRID